MVEEESKQDDGRGIGTLFIIGTVVIIIIVGLSIFNALAHPFSMGDSLKERLNALGNVSDDYRQGWLDCINYYLKLETGPTNSTSNGGK